MSSDIMNLSDGAAHRIKSVLQSRVNEMNRQDMQALFVDIGLAAVDYAKQEDAEEKNVKKFVDAMRQLCETQQNIKAYEEALRQVNDDRSLWDHKPLEEINFQNILHTKYTEYKNQRGFKQASTNAINQEVTKLKRELWSVSHPHEAFPDDDDDDIAVVGGTEPNLICPITLEPMEFALKNSCGHTYSKEGILGLLGNQSQIKCVMPGCSGVITRQSLKKDFDVIKRVQRNKRAGLSQHRNTQDDGATLILDDDDDDEE